jgi:hypothetical protein
MIDFFILLLCASALCIGVFAITRSGSVLGFWSKIVKNENNELRFVLAKPLSECLTCMSSLYGFIMYGMFFGFKGNASILHLLLLGLIALSILGEVFAKSPEQKEASQVTQKAFYLTFIAFSCLVMFQEKFIESFVFIICLSGCNYFTDSLLAAIQSDIESNENRILNEIDQGQALEEICERLENIGKRTKNNKKT